VKKVDNLLKFKTKFVVGDLDSNPALMSEVALNLARHGYLLKFGLIWQVWQPGKLTQAGNLDIIKVLNQMKCLRELSLSIDNTSGGGQNPKLFRTLWESLRGKPLRKLALVAPRIMNIPADSTFSSHCSEILTQLMDSISTTLEKLKIQIPIR